LATEFFFKTNLKDYEQPETESINAL